jgi:hypothetical protein
MWLVTRASIGIPSRIRESDSFFVLRFAGPGRGVAKMASLDPSSGPGRCDGWMEVSAAVSRILTPPTNDVTSTLGHYDYGKPFLPFFLYLFS